MCYCVSYYVRYKNMLQVDVLTAYEDGMSEAETAAEITPQRLKNELSRFVQSESALFAPQASGLRIYE